MLEEQRERVKADTAKYLALYEEKHGEAASLKQALLAEQTLARHQEQAIDNLTTRMLRDRAKTKRHALMSVCMRRWQVYRQERATRHYRRKLAEGKCLAGLGRRLFRGWAEIILARRRKQQEEAKAAKEKQEFADACYRY